MSRNRRRHVSWLAVLVAISSWSYLSIWSASAEVNVLERFYLDHYLLWAGSLTAVGLVVVGVARLIHNTGSMDRAYAAAVVAVFLIQTWSVFGPVHTWASGWIGTVSSIASITALWTLIVVLAHRTAERPSVLSLFWVVAAFLVGLTTFHALTFVVSSPDAPEPAALTVADVIANSPDVYVVVLDGYGRSDVLMEDLEFDNSGVAEGLARAGVIVLDSALSNYSSTPLSVASLLDGDYPFLEGDLTDENRLALQAIHAGDNHLFRTLKAAGYETHLFDNAWTFTQCGANVDRCHRTALWTELDYSVARLTPLLDLVPSLRINPWTRVSVDQLQAMKELATTPSDSPRVAFLHALIPHPPFHLDANCAEFADPSLEGYSFIGGTQKTNGLRLAAYVEQLQCVNRIVTDLANAIPPDAIILITADHGPTFRDGDPNRPATWTPKNLIGRFGVFMAGRLPLQCQPFHADSTVVSASRQIIDCVTETTQPSSSPALHYIWSESEGQQWVTEVTDILRSDR